MKRSVAMFLCLCLLVLIPGFAGGLAPKDQVEEGYALYFLVEEYEDSAGGGALAAERIDVEGENSLEIARALVEKLLQSILQMIFQQLCQRELLLVTIKMKL